MGEGLNVSRGVSYQPPVQDTNSVDVIKSNETKVEAQPAAQPKDKPSVSNPSRGKLEHSINGTARQAELNGHLQNKTTEAGASIKEAQKILDNPKSFNHEKIAELQKILVNTDKAEFANFVKKFPSFSKEQKQLIHSALTGSEKLMARVGRELPQAEQLKLIWNAVMSPSVGRTEMEEARRLEHFDRGIAAWMKSTDVDTLNKALNGKNIDVRASAKLLAVLATNAGELIFKMGHDEGKIIGDNYALANDLKNAVMYGIDGRQYTRDEIERTAVAMIIEQSRMRHERNVIVFTP